MTDKFCSNRLNVTKKSNLILIVTVFPKTNIIFKNKIELYMRKLNNSHPF